MHHIRILITTLALTAILTGCSRGHTDAGEATPQSLPDGNPKSELYNLGARHASDMLIECGDTLAIQEYLLEIAARRSNIGARMGRQAAADYQSGFKDYIINHNDSLARILF